MRLRVDQDSRIPLYVQIAEQIRRDAGTPGLPLGARLPATRELARSLGVHRNTVVAAYQLLEQEGLLRSAVGSGTFVVSAPVAPAASDLPHATGPAQEPFSWLGLVRGAQVDPLAYIRAAETSVADNPILLSGAVPDHRLYPMEDFAGCMEEVLARADTHMLEYGPIEGLESLRAWIADWLVAWGVEGLRPERVFVTSGSQQGLDLVARLLVAPGDRVLIEAPTYTGAHMVLREAGAVLDTVPVDDEGLVVAAVDEALQRGPVRFLYTMPCYQNPTGASLAAARRTQLLELARRRRLAIVEDHYTSQLHYDGPRPRPLLADDHDGRVIHLGTFSKILFPGLRLGWLVVPPEIDEPLRRLRWATDLATGAFSQRVLDRFCRTGRLERHVEQICAINRRRRDAMLAALEEHFPRGSRWSRPQGGMTLWTELPGSLDTAGLLQDAAARGVLYTPGTAFYPNGGGHSAMRLSFHREDEERIRTGVRRLGELLRARLRSGAPGGRRPSGAVPIV